MPESSRVLRVAAVPLMLVAGALVALQSQVNGHLATRLGEGPRAGFAAAVISFGSGLLILLAGSAVVPRLRRQVAGFVAGVRSGSLRPVELIGGLFGGFFVACQGLSVATLGVALFSVALTAGQTTSGLVVDHVGLSPAGRQPVATVRVVATGLTVVAVVVATWSRLSAHLSVLVVGLALLAVLAGCGWPVQQALNGRLSQQVGPWPTTLNNFVVGTSGLVVVFALSLLGHGRLHHPPADWWLYLGGLIGICFIWLAAVLVKVYGILVLSLSMIAGQVIGGLLIESVTTHHAIGAGGLVAGALTILAVLLGLLSKRIGAPAKFMRPKHPVDHTGDPMTTPTALDPLTLREFNAASEDDLRSMLLSCVAIKSWATTLEAERPFPDVASLLRRARDLTARWTPEEVEGALADHPRIGDKPTATSRSEQAGVSEDLAEAFAEANRRYEQRFGRIYLVRAAGRTGTELLALLESRLENDPATELAVTREQLGEIALLRLEGHLQATTVTS